MDGEAVARQEVGFFGPAGSRLFGCLHLSGGPTRGAVLVCPALHAELIANYRKEVLLARALSAAGLAALRFQYRGSGNSEGESRAATFDSMLQDARAAIRHLRERTGADALGLVGTRYGALVAAATADAGAPLLLWDPVVDPERYFRETFRARLIHDMRAGRASRAGSRGMLEELRREGSVDVLGYEITRDLYDSSVRVTLAELLRGAPRPLLVLQLSSDPEVRVEYLELLATLAEAGVRATVDVVPEDPAWWFFDETWEPEEAGAGTRALVDGSVAWLAQRLRAVP